MEYRRIGDYIKEVDSRNRDLKITKLVGLTINKAFIPSVANVIGTDLSSYKVIQKEQFACSLMQVSRDGKMPVAMFEEDEAIMSPAYPMFEVIDKDALLPQYLMMWFSRSEFDREASFYAVGGVRGSLTWEDFCNMKLPVPSVDRQREIVEEYETLSRRIRLNEQMIEKLEATAQALYRKMFVDGIDKENLPLGWRTTTIKDFCKYMTSGGTPLRTINEYWNKKDYRWLKTGEVHNNVILDTEEYISQEGLNNSSAKLIPKGSVSLAMYCANGVTGGQVAYLDCDTTTNQACCNMICHSKNDAAYLFFYFLNYQEVIKRNANGAAQANLSQEIIAAQEIIQFCDEDLKIPFVEILDKLTICYKIIKNAKELQSLLLAKMGNLKQ